MSDLRVRKGVTWLIAIFYGFLISLKTILDVLREGRSFFQVKKRDTAPQALLNPELGTHNFISLQNSIKLHYVENGDKDKPLCLFLHGFPECWYSWRHQIKALKGDYWTVAPDMRGYGESDKPKGIHNYTTDKLVEDVRQLIEGLGRQQAIVVCHDWGGAIGYLFAAKHPEMVEKLIVLNAPHFQHFSEILEGSWKQFFKSWYMYFFVLPFLPELRCLSKDLAMLDRLFVDVNGQPQCSPEDIEVYKYYFSKPGAMTPPINWYRARVLITTPPPRSHRITMPTLVIWGVHDMALSLELATGCSKYIDNYSIKLIEDGTHFIQTDKPEAVNQAIKDFLNQGE